MADGRQYDPAALTVATWLPIPLGVRVRITSACGSVEAEVTDRMPRYRWVIADLSDAVAEAVLCRGFGVNVKGISYGREWIRMDVR
jgi:rare lipoprotein A (peptidoglycan hydrolase)